MSMRETSLYYKRIIAKEFQKLRRSGKVNLDDVQAVRRESEKQSLLSLHSWLINHGDSDYYDYFLENEKVNIKPFVNESKLLRRVTA